jgi:hypothetical protein
MGTEPGDGIRLMKIKFDEIPYLCPECGNPIHVRGETIDEEDSQLAQFAFCMNCDYFKEIEPE